MKKIKLALLIVGVSLFLSGCGCCMMDNMVNDGCCMQRVSYTYAGCCGGYYGW